MFSYTLRKIPPYCEVLIEVNGEKINIGMCDSNELIELAEELTYMAADLLQCRKP